VDERSQWRERTALAWQRSALALLLVAALLLRERTALGLVAGLLLIAGAAVAYERRTPTALAALSVAAAVAAAISIV
jgi:uncharacterized membrane protein YidH (DUF202 family)